MDTALCQCSWSFYITIMSEQIHGRNLWNCHWDLFSKIGSCVCSGSGRPSTTLCVFHWTTVSVSIGFMKVETSLQSFVYNYCANYNQLSNMDNGHWTSELSTLWMKCCFDSVLFVKMHKQWDFLGIVPKITLHVWYFGLLFLLICCFSLSLSIFVISFSCHTLLFVTLTVLRDY